MKSRKTHCTCIWDVGSQVPFWVYVRGSLKMTWRMAVRQGRYVEAIYDFLDLIGFHWPRKNYYRKLNDAGVNLWTHERIMRDLDLGKD